MNIHASAVVIAEAGVLIRGASGSGKSRLALALLAGADAADLFARLIGDDRIALEARHGRLIASGHPLTRGLIEQRSLGIAPAPWVSAGVVRLVIDIADAAAAARFPEPDGAPDQGACGRLPGLNLLGVWLPLMTVPAAAASADLAAGALRHLRIAASGQR